MKELMILFFSLLLCNSIFAADFYVDPINGSMTNDGSQSYPWSTLQDVWTSGKIESRDCSAPCSTTTPVYATKNSSGPVKPGDTIYLMSGEHGTLSVTGGYNSDWIYIKAFPGQTPQLKNIFLRSVSNWSFEGLSISHSYDPEFINPGWLFKVEDHSWTGPSNHVTLKNSSLFSITDSSVWVAAEDWLTNAAGGVFSNADYTTLENLQIKNVAFGVVFHIAHYSTIINSTLDHMSYDGLWLFGSDYAKAEYNTIKNILSVDAPANHYDMIQSSTVDGVTVRGVEIRGNTLIAYEKADQPFVSDVQGIGCFDGWYEDYIIENNLVVTNTNQGIALTGARNSRIVNNTVINRFSFASYPPNNAPIGIYKHKNGTLGYGNVARNNYAMATSNTDNATFDHNILNQDRYSIFTNPDNFDYTVKQGSIAINAGSIDLAPAIDLSKDPRDAEPDIGAYEYGGVVAALKRHLRPSTGGMYIFSNGTHPVLNN